MRFKKSCLICVVLVLALIFGNINFVFAAADVEKDYSINYKDFSTYKSVINYIKNYEIEYSGHSVLLGNTTYKTKFIINNKIIEKDKPVTLNSLKKYTLKVYKNNKVFKTINGTLKKGDNIILAEFNNSNNLLCKYQFKIFVNEINTNEIDKNKFHWIKVEKVDIKWINDLKYGPYNNYYKKLILLNESKKYITSKNIYAKGKIKYNRHGKTSQLYFTENKKLEIGENKLKTKSILIKKNENNKYWFKAVFTVDLEELEEPVETPNPTIEPKPTMKPAATPISNNELPDTGEKSPIIFIIIGIGIIIMGCIVFAKRDKIIKTN